MEKKIDDLLASVEDPLQNHPKYDSQASGASAEQMMNGTVETTADAIDNKPDGRQAKDETSKELPLMGASKN